MRDAETFPQKFLRRASAFLFRFCLLHEEHLLRKGFSARCISVKIHPA
jgi:hypothetical protein